VVFGTLEAIEQVLAKHGWQINTSFVEGLNLDVRQHVAAIGRRVNTVCKHEGGLRWQLALFHTYHNFYLPHASLRVPLAVPEPTNGTGAARQWRPPTQSQKPNMFSVSMPNFATSAALVETATKCLATDFSSPPRPASDQSRAVCALVMVSRVVKVFEEIIKRVSAGARS